jgi:hypothetical protein
VLRGIPDAAWLPEADPAPVAAQLLAGTLAGAVLASILCYAVMLYLGRGKAVPDRFPAKLLALDARSGARPSAGTVWANDADFQRWRASFRLIDGGQAPRRR